ncbi:hypothetical protein [uncultured Stenotrophomonas sp.]|uniref:hypothetical protein n=1 Tax=uncultured Stenotrophomonas sp. TaxID=165438 RepID=UPI0028E66F45|nr:hypothetical protein [uncultured Stenotrophomonas sp.]
MTNQTAAVGSVARPPIIGRKALDEILRRVDLRAVSNRESPVSARCQMPYVGGTHERSACERAISSAYDVIANAHGKMAGDKADAMKKSLEILHPSSAERFGNTLQVHWTILGTLHEALQKRASVAPDDPVPKAMLPKVEASIIELAVKAGQCKGIADGTYHGDSKSLKLSNAIIAAKKLVTECATKMGGESLLCNIAEAILPAPMKDSIAERLPHLVDVFDKPGSVSDNGQILHKNMMDGLARTLRIHIENGGSESYINAILHLLKLPEYVVQGAQGKAGEPTDAPAQDDAPVDPLRLARDLNGNGAPIAINHAPVTVKTGQSQQPPAFTLTEIRNLVDSAFDRGYALAESKGLLRATQEQLARSEARADRLQRQLDRLQAWVAESDARRVVSGSNTDSVEHERTISSSVRSMTLESEPRVLNIDAESRAGVGSDLTHSQHMLSDGEPRQLDLVQRGGQLDADGRDKDIRQDERSDQLLERGGRNGDGGVRRAPPGSEDQTDGRTLDVKTGTQSALPKNDASGTLEALPRNRQARLGDADPRGERRTDSLMTSRHDGSAASGAPAQEDALVGEFERYLQTFGIEQRPLPRDVHQPVGPRNLKQVDADGGTSGPGANRTLLPSDLVGYRDARALLSGVPFIPVSTGKVAKPLPASPKGEFARFVDQLGIGKVNPTHVMEKNGRGSVPPATLVIRGPVSELERAFEGHRSRKMNPLLQPVPPAAPRHSPASVPVRESVRTEASDFVRKPAAALSPLTVLARSVPWPPASAPTTVARNRSDSLASISSSGSRADSLREKILSDSRSPSGAATP